MSDKGPPSEKVDSISKGQKIKRFMELKVPGFCIWLKMDQYECISLVTHDNGKTSWKLENISILLKKYLLFWNQLTFSSS